MNDFEKKLVITVAELLEDKNKLKQDVEYWKNEVTRLNNLYEWLTRDYIELSKSKRNG
jgi:poly(3-hydroxyalkanoate) synthetase